MSQRGSAERGRQPASTDEARREAGFVFSESLPPVAGLALDSCLSKLVTKSAPFAIRCAPTIERVSAAEPRPNPETVAALLDTTWRLASAETARTEALDRKAATVATFASVLATLTATLGVRFVDAFATWWALALFLCGLAAFLGSVVLAVAALLPEEYLTLGIAYLRRFPTWSEISKPPEQVSGAIMRALESAIVLERKVNDRKGRAIRHSFTSLLAGLMLLGAEAAILAIKEVV